MGCQCNNKCKNKENQTEKDLRQQENGMINQSTEQKYVDFNSKDSNINSSRSPLTLRNFKHYIPKHQKDFLKSLHHSMNHQEAENNQYQKYKS